MTDMPAASLLTPPDVATGVDDSILLSGPGRPLRVVVVDDNVDAADLMSMFFMSIGHDAKSVYGGQAALECIPQFKPHVLFIDIGMPHIDGRDLVRLLRKNSELASSMFVAFSGYCDDESKSHAFEAGFHRYISKPSSLTALSDLMEEYSALHP